MFERDNVNSDHFGSGVHLWTLDTLRLPRTRLIPIILEYLSPDEIVYARLLISDDVKLQFLFTRFMIRFLLTHYYPQYGLKHWQFRNNEFGRPEVANADQSLHLTFNIAHAEGMIVVALTRDRKIGVDIEFRERQIDLHDMVQICCGESEREQMSRSIDQRRTFFQLWTLKEAYLKACGIGLAVPLNEISFNLFGAESHLPPSAKLPRLLNGLSSFGNDWQLELFEPRPSYQLALAVSVQLGEQVAVQKIAFDIVEGLSTLTTNGDDIKNLWKFAT